MTTLRIPATVLALLALSLIAGCSGTPLFDSTPFQQSSIGNLRGKAFGGQQPVVGMQIYLYEAATSAYGAASTSKLVAAPGMTQDGNGNYYATTDSSGSFSLTGAYTCTVGAQVYVYAVGGDAGAGFNTGAGLMAALGQCPPSGSLASTVPYLWISEATTVAAAYALSGFAVDPLHIADDENDSNNTTQAQAQTGMANAFTTAGNLVDISIGAARASTPGGNGTVPQTEINSLANILAACVNSTGPGSTACSSLFSTATSDGTGSGTPAADTAEAAINIAHHPEANVSALFNLIPPTTPFSPSLSSAPNDWTLAIKYTGGGLSFPRNPAIDASGNVWVSSYSGSVLSQFSTLGVPASPTGYSGGGLSNPTNVAIDLSGNAWVANNATHISEFDSTGAAISSSSGYTGGGVNGAYGIAVDTTGAIWVSSPNANLLSKFASDGTAISTSSGYIGGGINVPYGIAIDPSNNVWVANYSGASISELATSGTPVSGASGYTGGGLAYPLMVAFDAIGNVFASSITGSQISEFASDGTAISGSSGYTGGGLASNRSIAVDGDGNVWVASTGNNTLSEFTNSGTPISPSTGFKGGSITYPWGLAIDGSGNIWTADYSISALTEFVGGAAPVVTPIVAAVKNNKLGTRP